MRRSLRGLFSGMLFLLLAFAIPGPLRAPWVSIEGYESSYREPVKNIKGRACLVSLCLDSNDFPHIAWTEKNQLGQHETYYLKWNGSSWVDIDGSDQESIKVLALTMHSLSMCLDSVEHPHIAWNRSWGIEEDDHIFLASEIYYLWWNGSEWVDSDGAGRESMKVGTGCEYHSPFLCLDSDDRPHLLVIKEYASFLCRPHVCYLWWNGSRWVETRRPGEKGGDVCDISKGPESLWLHLDPDGQPYIALALPHENGGRICHLYWNASRKLWGRRFIEFRDPEGCFAPSVCLDSRNYPHIAYFDARGEEIYYLQWNGNEWIDPEVPTWPKFIELFKDKWKESQWWTHDFLTGFQEAEAEEFTTHIGESVRSFSLRLDSKDRPHIAYIDDHYKQICYFKWVSAELYRDEYTYYIRGYVRDEGGKLLGEVTVNLSGDICSGTYTTSDDGYYEFVYLPIGDYTVNPQKSGCSFKREKYEYKALGSNKDNQNFEMRSLRE